MGIANSPTTPMLSSLRCQNDVDCVFASVMLFPPGVADLLICLPLYKFNLLKRGQHKIKDMPTVISGQFHLYMLEARKGDFSRGLLIGFLCDELPIRCGVEAREGVLRCLFLGALLVMGLAQVLVLGSVCRVCAAGTLSHLFALIKELCRNWEALMSLS